MDVFQIRGRILAQRVLLLVRLGIGFMQLVQRHAMLLLQATTRQVMGRLVQLLVPRVSINPTRDHLLARLCLQEVFREVVVALARRGPFFVQWAHTLVLLGLPLALLHLSAVSVRLLEAPLTQCAQLIPSHRLLDFLFALPAYRAFPILAKARAHALFTRQVRRLHPHWLLHQSLGTQLLPQHNRVALRVHILRLGSSLAQMHQRALTLQQPGQLYLSLVPLEHTLQLPGHLAVHLLRLVRFQIRKGRLEVQRLVRWVLTPQLVQLLAR